MSRFARPENFADRIRTPLLREHFVYRAYAANGDLLYIGCSKDLTGRMKAHKTSRDWYDQMARLKVAGPYNWETARQLERDAIRSERALYNNQTPERVAVCAAHTRVYKRRFRALTKGGMDFWPAVDEALAHAARVLPEPPNRSAFRATDLTVPQAMRDDRADAATYEQAAS